MVVNFLRFGLELKAWPTELQVKFKWHCQRKQVMICVLLHVLFWGGWGEEGGLQLLGVRTM